MEQHKPAPPRSTMWMFAISAVIIAAAIAAGASLLGSNAGAWHLLGAGVTALLIGLLLYPMALSADRMRRENLAIQQRLLENFEDRMQQFSVMLDQMSEQQLLSDRAKLVAYRDKDREALRRAIREEIARGDWEAALTLVSDMENAFGYRVEAERFREEIAGRHKEAVRRQVNEAMVVIDRHVRVEAWTLAAREVERLQRLFPDDEAVQRLPGELEQRRAAVKQRLLESWHEASARHDIDGSIEILKKLDLYLTAQEADQMKDSVRSIFEEKFNSLRNQFAAAVQEKRINDAIRVAEVILKEFPNRRASHEIRDRMESLRKMVQPQPAGVA